MAFADQQVWRCMVALGSVAIGFLVAFGARAGQVDEVQLRRMLAGQMLKATTAKDNEAWQVRLERDGEAHFTFTDGSKRSATWSINGQRIDFYFEDRNERTCRMIFLADDGRQHWQDCSTLGTSSYIVEPRFSKGPMATQPTGAPGSIEVRLETEVASLRSRGFESWLPTRAEQIAHGSSARVSLDLEVGRTYAVIASCEEKCSHVAVSLRSPSGQVLAQSPEQQATVILSGAASVTGRYDIEITAPGCREARCRVGIRVLRRK